MIMAVHGYPGQEPYLRLEIVPPEEHTLFPSWIRGLGTNTGIFQVVPLLNPFA
jgi:hypothetical protein